MLRKSPSCRSRVQREAAATIATKRAEVNAKDLVPGCTGRKILPKLHPSWNLPRQVQGLGDSPERSTKVVPLVGNQRVTKLKVKCRG